MKFKCSMKVVITCAVSISLAFLLIFAINLNSAKVRAFGDAQAVNNYKEAKAFVASVRAEYNAIMKKADSLYNSVEGITDQAFAAQAELTTARLKFNDLAKYQYMNSVQLNIISMLLNSTSIDEFFKNLEYANTVMDYEYSIAREQAEKKAAFDQKLDELNSQTAAQNSCLQEAWEKLAQANAVLQAVRSKLTPEELAELEGEISDIGGGGGDTPTPGPTPPGPQPTPPGPSWNTGLASAYGGSTDSSTGPVSYTSIGERVDDTTTGVAVPMSWPNYKSYYHHTVQISWNGMTLLGRINDCGNLSGGKRSLDLQPGIFRAFGFGSCNAWGVRTVSYLIM